MNMNTAFKALFGLSFFFLASCSWTRDQVVDHAAGFPASHVISDVKSTSDEYKQEKHEERVEELNSDYEAFLRSQETVAAGEEAAEQSVIIKQENNEND